MGSVYRDLGKLSESLDHLERSVELRKRIGDRHGEGFGLHSLALTRTALGDHQEVVRLLHESILAHQEVGNLLGEADVQASLGDILRSMDEIPAAVAAWRRAAEIYDTIGSPQAAAIRADLQALTVPEDP
ncbi:hypothetical protein GCM10027184_75500 [Saccharothrix stipae]